MTREEAVRILGQYDVSAIQFYETDGCEIPCDKGYEAIEMAIEALVQLPSVQPEKRTEKRTETHACDLVSRQAAIDALCEDYCSGHHDCKCYPKCENLRAIQDLPSAQTEQNPDEWCTDCKEYDKERHCCPRFNRVIRTAMEDASRWIPVEARLPEDKQKCLLTLSCFQSSRKYVVVGTYVTDLYSVNKYDFADKKGASGWYYRDSEYGYIEYDSRVIAWMPLPDPA